MSSIINQRLEDEGIKSPAFYLVIQGLHGVRELRQEEGGFGYRFSIEEERYPSPLEQFSAVLREGLELGFHVLAWCDTVTNMKRVLDRRMLGEFGMRVGAMSNDDSLSLLDEPAASRLDKPHRAIFYDEERPGYLGKFRCLSSFNPFSFMIGTLYGYA